MGLGLFSSCSSCGTQVTIPSRNPNPRRFEIKQILAMGTNVLIEVVYPDCINYEGRKILVYRGVKPETVLKATELDPHFCDKKNCLSPFARFEPTRKGWDVAVSMLDYLWRRECME